VVSCEQRFLAVQGYKLLSEVMIETGHYVLWLYVNKKAKQAVPWLAPVPNKVKVHAWCLVENGLLVGSQLQHWKINQVSTVLLVGEWRTLCTHSGVACTGHGVEGAGRCCM
jgi:hypothetical protein